MNPYINKKVAVVGLARSGMAAARLLKKLGAEVSVTEKSVSAAAESMAAALRQEGIFVELGLHSPGVIEGRGLVVISPGVRLDADPVLWARDRKIEVVSEIELASSVCRSAIVAVTGTNGKTTTTTLIGEVLRAAGRKAAILGNIGTPFSQQALELEAGDFVSLEVSSFQLEAIKNFRPRVAVVLNLTPDHLDRYKDMAEYLEAKKRIYLNQGADDTLVLNYGDPMLRPLAQDRPRAVFFNREDDPALFDQNQMAVMAVARVLGIDREVCLGVFRNFKGVEHRMEFVREIGGVAFVNDSKATNIDSTVWALTNIKKPAVLIAGGRDKGSDFASITGLVRRKVKHVVLCGEASDRIALAWEGVVPLERAASYEEAVAAASRHASRGDIVLLSPMCKSFDLFTDYEHRGRVFKELVNKL